LPPYPFCFIRPAFCCHLPSGDFCLLLPEVCRVSSALFRLKRPSAVFCLLSVFYSPPIAVFCLLPPSASAAFCRLLSTFCCTMPLPF
jgi:hypothetical protein